jgi:hypothetical protein
VSNEALVVYRDNFGDKVSERSEVHEEELLTDKEC